jgi:hypothetical protein
VKSADHFTGVLSAFAFGPSSLRSGSAFQVFSVSAFSGLLFQSPPIRVINVIRG